MSRIGKAVALALLAHQYALALAQEPVAAMATVEIVGNAPLAGMGIERRLLPYALQVAESEDLHASHGANLAEYLARNLSGVNANDISGSPFQNDITYRGFRVSPVLGTAQGISVYLDGVRINEPFGDVVNWDMLPESAIARVRMVPGSHPVYGLNTLGGALALEGKSGATHPGVEIELSGTSHGRKRADLARGALHGGGWHSFIGATLFDDDGWRAQSQGRLANAYLKLGREGAGASWWASLQAGRSRLHGNGLLPDQMYQEDRRAAYTFPDQTRNRLAQATLAGKLRLGAGVELSGLAYARGSWRDTVNGDAEQDDDGPEGELNTSRTRQRGQGASVLLGVRRAAHRFDAGATFDRSSVSFAQFEQDGILTDVREVLADPGAEREDGSSVIGSSRAAGLFVSDTWSLSRNTHLTAAARLNRARVSNTLTSERGVQPHERFFYTRLNPSVGIAHEAGGLALTANIAQGNRVPTVIELGCADPEQPCQLPVGLQSDPYLRQVVARTVELGARYQRGGWNATLSLYRTVNRDDILFLSSGQSRQGYFSNFERTRHQGLDATARKEFGAWSLRTSYSYLDATYDAVGVLFTGARTVAIERGAALAGLPRHTLKLAADWRVAGSFTVSADLQAVSSMASQGNEDGLAADREDGAAPQPASLRVRGYGLINLGASWQPGARWEWYARLNNAANRRYETFGAVARNLFPKGGVEQGNSRFVAPGAPRTLVFGVRYRY